MENKTLRKADMVTSIILFVFAVTGIALSVPLLIRTVQKGEYFYKSAGLFPMIVSALLVLCAVNLFLRARKDGAKFDFFKKEKFVGFIKGKEFKIAIFIIGLLALYIFVLLPFLTYSIASFLFLFSFMLFFKGLRSKKGILIAFIVSAVTTAVLTYGFGELAMIPLP